MNNSRFYVIIPARMHSSRVAHKMIQDIGNGIPLVVKTAFQALKSKAYKVIVATDHPHIQKICKQYNSIDVCMTSTKHKSGTDRLAEVVTQIGLANNEIVINVQGDEPLIDPELINKLAEFKFHSDAEVATVAHTITTADEVFNPNIVKVVLDKSQHALYFSRSAIPFYRDGLLKLTNHTNNDNYHSNINHYINGSSNNGNNNNFIINKFQVPPPKLNLLRHIGIYAYSVKFLKEYQNMPECALEHIESLEQLRILYNGNKISVLVSNIIPEAGVDTTEDLERIRQIISSES